MVEESFGLFSTAVQQRHKAAPRLGIWVSKLQCTKAISGTDNSTSYLVHPPSDASCTATGPWRIGGIRGASMEWGTLVGCCLAACVRWTPCRDDGDGWMAYAESYAEKVAWFQAVIPGCDSRLWFQVVLLLGLSAKASYRGLSRP